MLCAFVRKVNTQSSSFVDNKHFSFSPHPGSLESACLERMTCCVVWNEFRQHKTQLLHSSIACPALPFFNNLSRQLEWLFYEYALKILSCALFLSVRARACANTLLRACSSFPPETKEVSGRISPHTTERPESLEMHHRFCWVAHELRCLPLPLCSPTFTPTPKPPSTRTPPPFHSWAALTRLLEEDKAC